jgi:plasmid stabilization system protein ParE
LLRRKSILIVRVLHGRRDLQSIFDTSEEEEEPRQP